MKPTDKPLRQSELNKAEEFLQKLRELCLEYEATIDGCGCCGSPFGTVGRVHYDKLEITKRNFIYHMKETLQ